MSPSAQRGLALTQSVGCTACHSGVNFAGPALPEGQGFYQKFPLVPAVDVDKQYALTADQGRFAVTKSDADKNSWRVPTWRNVALTAPYFHNGSVESLDEAVRIMGKTQLGRDLKAGEVTDLVAFLNALTGVRPKQPPPKLPQ